MVQHWQEILPVDHYKVASNGLLHENDRKVLTFLYQPLVGPVCLSLYMTLWAELEENRLWSGTASHHSLMSLLDMNLKDIYHSRLKLEAMGLLKTFVKNDDDHGRSFIYELQPPLTPEQFFLDGLLNIYLYRKVGRNQFARLKRFFADQSPGSLGEYSEVTKAFQDVFVSVSPDTLQFHQGSEGEFQPQEGQVFMGRQDSASIQIPASEFNFELLLGGLNESLVSKDALTDRVKEAISNLAFLYSIDAVQMKNIVLSALTPDGEVDIEELRKAARDWYQFEHQDQLPQLMDRVQPAQFETASNAPKTEEDEIVLYFETASPRQLLVDISGGAEPTKSELQMIEDIMFKQKLLPGVVNVLVHYVMLRTNMKLTKAFIEKIASHWSRLQIKTVKEAMDLAKLEHKQYLQWAEEKKTRPVKTKKPVRKEVLPDWFENKESNNGKDAASDEEDFDFEEEKRLLEEELKQFKNGR